MNRINDVKDIRVLDLFCGAGGLSIGFKKAGFNVTGVDISKYAQMTYEYNKIGHFLLKDLSKEEISEDFDIIIGGPPCRPWSSVNMAKRSYMHEDYGLVERFFNIIKDKRPKYFILENVPPLLKDKIFNKNIEKLNKYFSIKHEIIKYSDYGAATSRKRLILFGIKEGLAEEFFKLLSNKKCKSKTVRDVIGYLIDKKRGEIKNHEWPEFKTIDYYREKYEKRQYGWYVLEWDKPAPSFGNITKTYILYPGAFNGGPKRVISVKEALLIMGYDKDYYFPDKIGIGTKYQMIADSVSPDFSYVAAEVIKEMIINSK